MPLPPRFVDTYSPRSSGGFMGQAASGYSASVAPLFVDQFAVDGTRRDWRKIDEQTRHYTYWNYVATNRICDYAGGLSPEVGVNRKKAGQVGKGNNLDPRQRAHLQRVYGWQKPVVDNLEPAPETHPLVTLLDDVNPEDAWSEFLFELLMDWRITGYFYIWAIPNGFGLPAELWIIPPHWITPKYSESGKLLHWRVVPDGDERRARDIPADQIIEGKRKNPRSKREAYSPLQAGSHWIDNVEQIEMSRRAGFANGVNPDIILQLGEQYSKPTEGELRKLKEKFMLRSANLVKRMGEPVISPPNVKVEKWSNTPREMAWTESAAQARDNNLALHGVPPVVAGVTSDYTRATAEAALVVFCEFTINPELRRLANILTEKLATRFDPRLVIWFPDCTPENAEFELKALEAHFKMGGVTSGEVRESAGREPIDGPLYETGWIPAGMSPLNEDLQPEPIDDETDDEPDDPPPDDAEGADGDETDDAGSGSEEQRAAALAV